MGIYAAATRRTLDGKNPEGWVPEQKITVAEAVHAYTIGSAYAEGEEKIKGSIAPGKLADLVVLTEDIFHIDPVEIWNTKVDTTIFDGKNHLSSRIGSEPAESAESRPSQMVAAPNSSRIAPAIRSA